MKKWILLLFYISVGFAQNTHEKGRQYFQMYCSACHGLSYGAIETLHKPVLSAEDAQKWFGQQPPDLSLVTLKYSKTWLVAYLTGFYPDQAHRFGSNNHLIPNVMMPNVFASLGKSDKINIASEIADYLDDVSQPERHHRLQLGILVSLWCMLAVILSAMLSKIYKK